MNMESYTCPDFRHYRQHYIKYGKNYYLPISDGHCVHPRTKPQKNDTPACERFRPRKSDT